MKILLMVLAGFLAYVALGSLSEGASAGDTAGLLFASLFIVVPVLAVGCVVAFIKMLASDIRG